jgi:hypothetical protein
MLPDNEVPPIAAAGNSASSTITVRVARDDRGNVAAATVIFDIDYTVTQAVTFTGLHIHNAPAGQNGSIVIDSGISSASPVNASAGSGKIARVVNYASTDTNAIRFVTGLLATPENYYVNIHTTAQPNGFMRGQLQSSRLIFRPAMSTAFEVPAINLDAEGAARVEVQVNRDAQTGAITSGTVIFDVDYRFPGPVTLTGLHIHNAAAGSNGNVVIDTGITTTPVTNVTRGNIFRIVEITSSNTNGIAALNGLFTDPTQYYINLHTTVNPGGVIRGQLSKNLFAFFNLMTQAEEVPPTGVSGTANSMTYARVDRDSTGNVTGGEVSFNLNYDMGSAQTFTGLHIHNARLGSMGTVVINTGLNTANPVVTNAQGFGSINREVSSASFDIEFLRGLLENPENYYVNIHTPQFTNGVIRAQLARETYHFKTNMTTANEVPPVTGVDTAATGWVTARVNRTAGGTLTGGTVTFDVNHTNTGPVTFTGLHIHYPATAGSNANFVINTGLTGATPVESVTGIGNITRVVPVDSTNPNGVLALQALITAPDTAYINLHTPQNTNGVVRSQMFPVVNTVAEVAGGGEWLTVISIRNTSATAAVQGIVDFFNSDGSPMPSAITDPNTTFLIPPSGSTIVSTHNKGSFSNGFAKVFSNGNVAIEARYIHPSFSPNANTATTVTSRSVSLPVNVGATPTNTGIALIANSGANVTFSLVNAAGAPIPGGSRSIDMVAGQQLTTFVGELFAASVPLSQYTGTLTIAISSGTISVLALQFDGTIAPLTVTALP